MLTDNAGFALEHKIRIAFGPGRSAALGEALRDLVPPRRPLLLITDRGLSRSGVVERVVAGLEAAGHPTLALAELEGEPAAEDVDRHAEVVRRERPAAVVALGGGSALDLAKLAASVGAGDGGAMDHALLARPLPGGAPVVAVPTTAGTGAEVTRTAVFGAGGRKVWAWGEALRPALAVLDPELCLGLPRSVTAASGLDAVVHGVEAATNRRRNPFSEAYGLHAVDLALAHLPAVVRRPDDLEARGGMLLAACLAGLAIDIAGTGLAHAFGHALGTVAGMAHGPAVALGLSTCLGWNVLGEPGRHRALARTFGLAPELSPGDLAAAFERRWLGLVADLGPDLPALARGLDPERDRDALARALRAPENRPMVLANARLADDADLARLLDRLFELRRGLAPTASA